MLVNVLLTADLGDKFGSSHQYDLETPSEVFRALAANFPDFRSYLLASEDRGVGYCVFFDERSHDLDELTTAVNLPHSIEIVPVIAGSGGVGKIIAGVALLGLSLFAPFSIGLLGSGVLTSTTIGTGLLLSGMGELLAPRSDTADNNNSATTINSIGTVRQGDVIPVAFGKVYVQGRAISAGINVITS